MDAIDALRSPRRLLLPLALLAAFSPACLAQQSQQDTGQGEATSAIAAEATPEYTADGKPRSAFGRVMSLMIAALKNNADRPQPAARMDTGDAALPLDAATTTQEIQVSAAFRLDPPAPRSEPRTQAGETLAGAPDGN